MNIVLPPATEKLIQERIESGEYPNASELVDVAVHRLLDRSPNPKPANSRPLSEVLSGLVGAFDSTQETPDERHRSEYGDILDEKYRRQGIKTPWER